MRTEGLSSIGVNALFDSELEARFIEALRRARKDDRNVSLRKEIVNGKAGYFLKVGERPWYIEPQVSLGPGDGVTVPSKVDFLFRPARELLGIRPVAVFTDGFEYHRKRVGRDIAQRMALQRAGLRVWSLTFKDVENRFHSQGPYFSSWTLHHGTPGEATYDRLLEGCKVPPRFKKPWNAQDSFEWLMDYLKDPDDEGWTRHAFVNGLLGLDRTPGASLEGAWKTGLEPLLPAEMFDSLLEGAGPRMVGMMAVKGNGQVLWGHQAAGADGDGDEAPAMKWFATIAHHAVSKMDATGLKVACFLDDGEAARKSSEFETRWTGWLRMYNLHQFLPTAFFVTRQGQEGGEFEAVHPAAVASEQGVDVDRASLPLAGPAGAAEGWAEVLEDVVDEARPVAKRMAQAGWPPPEPGFELEDERGEIVGEAEMAWPATRLALLREDQADQRAVFETAGWTVHALSDALADPEWMMSLQKVQEGVNQ